MHFLKHFHNTKGVLKQEMRDTKTSLLFQITDYLAQLCHFLWTVRLEAASMFEQEFTFVKVCLGQIMM